MAAASLPLRYRLPNPPPFVAGRAEERLRLASAIERAPVSLVVGPGGMGKSTLVRATLHERFSARVPRIACLALRAGATVDELHLDLLRALGDLGGLAPVEWQHTARDPDAATAMAIDWAEETGAWVVLDDLHHAGAEATLAFLVSVARYARASRWIATSRATVSSTELAGQIVVLDALPEPDLRELARRCNPALEGEALQRILAASLGSPWQLLQYAANPETPRTAGGSAALAGLTDEALELLAALAMLGVPVPEDKLALAVTLPAPDVMTSLVERGLIERSAVGCRVHDVARPLLRDRAPDASGQKLATLAHRLLDAGEPGLGVEALRLFVEAGRLADARAVVERHADAFLDAGLAPRVWQVLEPVVDQGFVGVGLRCALSLGSGAALEWATARAVPETLADRALWMRALWSAREIEATLRAADQVAAGARAAGDEARVFEAELCRGQCLASSGKPTEARAVLEALGPADEDASARRDVFLALVLVQAADYRGALALANSLVARVSRLGKQAQREVRDELPTVFFNTGRIRAASELAAQSSGEVEGTAITLLRSLRSALRHTILALETGKLDRVRGLVGRVASFAHASPMQEAVLALVQTKLWIASGETERAERELSRVLEQAEAASRAGVYQWAMTCRAMLSILRAEPECLPEWSPKIPLPAGPQAVFLDAYRRIHAARASISPPPRIADPGHSEEVIDAHVALRLAEATEAFQRGRRLEALEAVRSAIAVAREHGLALQEADSRQALCEMLVASGEPGLGPATDELATLTSPFPSPRYDAEVRFFRAVTRASVDLAELESLATIEHAPEASRRARAWLFPGLGADRLDAMDRGMLEALRARIGSRPIETLGGGWPSRRWRAGWGMRVADSRVWLAAGRWVDLSRHDVLWRMLEVTWALGGAATKEQLVREVWSIPEYHPLRDDKRIQVSVRRLRTLLEDDASRPTRFVTTADGYAFGSAEAVRIAR